MRASALAAAVLGSLLLLAAPPARAQDAEPFARGKKLSEWIKILQEGDLAAREEAVTVIGRIGIPAGAAAVRPIAESLDKGTEKIQANGAWALGCIAGGPAEDRPARDVPPLLKEHAVAPLASLLRSTRSDVRLNAAWALGCIRRGDPAAVEGLLAVLAKEPEAEVRRNAAWALMRIASGVRGTAQVPDGIVPGLAAALADADEWVRSNAALGLWEVRETAAPAMAAVVARLASKSDSDRANALAILSRIGKGAADHAGAVKPLLSDPAPGVRQMAVMFLLGHPRGLPECVPALLKLLEDADPKVRGNAVYALGSVRAAGEEVRSALRSRAGIEKDKTVLGNLEAALAVLERDPSLGPVPGPGGSLFSTSPAEHHSNTVLE